MGVMIITHYQRILRYIKPNHVHILLDGRMVKSGGPELADVLEARGYDWVKKEVGEVTDSMVPHQGNGHPAE
jgi:Fe-S cluster assembly ATP-binding protein